MIRFDGADISHYQSEAGPIHWPTLRSVSGWVATKATQHTGYVDPYLKAHRAQMATQGFKHRGLYHWLSPQRKWLWGSFAWRPEDQAAHYLRTIGTLEPGEFVMLDAEEGGITAADVLAWCEVVEDVTHRPASVYTGAYVAGGTIWQSTSIRHSDYGPRPMHLAAYTSEAKALALPGVKAYPWSAWQYSSNGPVPGVVGRCDMNRVDMVEHYDIAAGVVEDPWPPPVPPNPPQEDEMIVTIFELVDSNAVFVGDTQVNGLASHVRWSGPGNQKWLDRRAVILGNGGRVVSASIGNLINFDLDPPLPTGDPQHDWTGDEFANSEAIKARHGPTVCHDEVARRDVKFVRDELESYAADEGALEARFERFLSMLRTSAGGD